MNEAVAKDLRVASRRVNATIPTAASRCRRLRISSQLFAREFRVSVHRNARAENVCACCIAASSPSPSSPIRRCGTRNVERVSHILKHFRLLSSQSYLSSLLYLVIALLHCSLQVHPPCICASVSVSGGASKVRTDKATVGDSRPCETRA